MPPSVPLGLRGESRLSWGSPTVAPSFTASPAEPHACVQCLCIALCHAGSSLSCLRRQVASNHQHGRSPSGVGAKRILLEPTAGRCSSSHTSATGRGRAAFLCPTGIYWKSCLKLPSGLTHCSHTVYASRPRWLYPIIWQLRGRQSSPRDVTHQHYRQPAQPSGERHHSCAA